jgi:hypothetical protein
VRLLLDAKLWPDDKRLHRYLWSSMSHVVMQRGINFHADELITSLRTQFIRADLTVMSLLADDASKSRLRIS